jgi:hypothetical protein
MALSTEETTDLRDTYSLLSAAELQAQLGDDPEQDAIIQALLDGGKQVETKGAVTEADDLPAVNTGADAAGGDDDDDDDDDDQPVVPPAADASQQPAATAPADAAAAVTDPAAAAADPAAAVVEAPAVVAAPLDLSFLDGQYSDKLTALDTTKAEALGKLMDGEITAAEYSKVESQYLRDRDALAAEKRDTAAWLTDIHAFKGRALAESGVNYDADPEKAAAWDGWVKHLASNPANAAKPDSWFLEQAHKKVMIEFEIAPAAAPAAAKPAAQPVVAAKSENIVAKTNRKAPNLEAIPPTLGALPSATSVDGGDGGEFAHLEGLAGMEYERALARLTPEQQARYAVS